MAVDPKSIKVGKTYDFQHAYIPDNRAVVTITKMGKHLITGEDDPNGMLTAVPVPNPHNQTWGVYADELTERDV